MDNSAPIENRQSHRDTDLVIGITCFVESRGGVLLEGIVRDVSAGGVRVAGSTRGIHDGDDVYLILVVMGDQKVGCTCEVRHVEEGVCYGLAFHNQPRPIAEERVARCTYCAKEFIEEYKYCAYCANRLTYHARRVPDAHG